MHRLQANGFYHGMFENAGMPHPLSISSDTAMLHANQMVSPATSIASDSSGPSSPDAGPFTPVISVPSANFSTYASSSSCIPESQMEEIVLCGGDNNVQFGYSAQFSMWENTWENQDNLLAGDEFDMSAIPPIELGIPGCGPDQLTPTSFDVGYAPGSYDVSQMQNTDTFDPLFHFEGMLPAQHGY
ncbi:hypothetical protein ID866_9190 [Astraeus odoratus]|nr:hypothetical protein ID866_9190 [Astraeus odoratus]